MQRLLLATLVGLLLGACSSERSRFVAGGGLAAGMAREDAEAMHAAGATIQQISESSDVGYVARVHGGVQLSRGWAALVELEYTDVTFDMNGREVDCTELSTFGSLRYTLEINSPLRPYAKAGVGVAKSFEGEEQTAYGAKVAVGAQFDLSEAVSLYGEGQYVEYFTPDYSIIGVGMRSDSVTYGVHAGVEFRF